jgi:HK97 family phage major capsid protein
VTDVLKMLEDQFAAMKAEQAQLIEKRGDAQGEAVTALEKRIDELETSLAKSRESLDKVERQGLPGLEYAEKGESDKFSLWRTMQLAVESADNPRAWENKYYGLEVEAMRQIERKGGYQPTAARANNTGTDSTGGVFVPSQVMFNSIIPELEARSVVFQAGAQRMDGLIGDITWITDEGGTTAVYIDNPSEEVAAESQDSFGTIKARPHTMSAGTRLTRDMRRQSAVTMEARVRAKFASKFALREDLSALKGTGVDSQPRGIANVSGINTFNFTASPTVVFTGATQNLTDKLRAMIYALRKANYFATGRTAWIAEPLVGEKIANAKDGDGQPLLSSIASAPLESIMGSPLFETTQVNTATASDAFLLYGDFSQLLMLHWGAMELEVGVENTDLSKGVRKVVGFMDHDVVVQEAKAFTLASNFTVA